MNELALSPERILDAAEDVLRRYGPAKATVVDVARALGVSHGTVYRHFASKAEIRDAVVDRWLGRISTPLQVIVGGSGPATVRLRQWLDTLIAIKRQKVSADADMFAAYRALIHEVEGAVVAHVAELCAQIGRIIADGVARGEFDVADPQAAGRAVFDATGRFHNPAHSAEWLDTRIDQAFEGVWALILNGLKSR